MLYLDNRQQYTTIGVSVYLGFAGVILRGRDTSNLLHFLEARILMQFMRRQAAA